MKKKCIHGLNDTIARHNLKQLGTGGRLFYEKEELEHKIEDMNHRLWNFENLPLSELCHGKNKSKEECIRYIEKQKAKFLEKLSNNAYKHKKYCKMFKYYNDVLYKRRKLEDVMEKHMFQKLDSNRLRKINNELTDYSEVNGIKEVTPDFKENGEIIMHVKKNKQ